MSSCLPVYVLIDTSKSMAPFEAMLNEGIVSLYDELITSPRICDFAHVSIISFNTGAEVVMQMTDLQSMKALPEVICGGVTYFNAAIALLRQRIDDDVPALKSAGRQVHRPVAFLLTDGVPTGRDGLASNEWRADYQELVSKSYANHPNVVPFGYGQASPQFLSEIATLPNGAFLAKDGGTEGALKKVIPALLNTLIISAKDNTLSVPTEVDGYIRVSNDVL
jgi:uncharacterized protein YegL